MHDQIWKSIKEIEKLREVNFVADKDYLLSLLADHKAKAICALNDTVTAFINKTNDLRVSMQKSVQLQKAFKEITEMRNKIIDTPARVEAYSNKRIGMTHGYRTAHTDKQLQKYSSYISTLERFLKEFEELD